jgi:hypothetical protein
VIESTIDIKMDAYATVSKLTELELQALKKSEAEEIFAKKSDV